jgi:hypothetical protein
MYIYIYMYVCIYIYIMYMYICNWETDFLNHSFYSNRSWAIPTFHDQLRRSSMGWPGLRWPWHDQRGGFPPQKQTQFLVYKMTYGKSVQLFLGDDRVGSAKSSGIHLLPQSSLIGQSKLFTKLYRKRCTLLEWCLQSVVKISKHCPGKKPQTVLRKISVGKTWQEPLITRCSCKKM